MPDSRHAWDEFLTERDREVFKQAGYGKRAGFGKRPALLVIDITYNFIGDKPEPILDSIKRWRNSCGEEGWVATKRVERILAAARASKIPIIYTYGEARSDYLDMGVRHFKNYRSDEGTDIEGHKGTQIAEPVAPQPGDLLISKKRASAFFGTPLAAHLIGLGVDTVIVTGCTTSGCVRASVVEGQSYNFKMIVSEDGVFDRGQASHALSLWDMQCKYADVVSSKEVIEYLEGLR